MTFSKKQKGFTLIETIVSIAIFSLIALAINETTLTIMRQSKEFRENTTISGLAAQYLEAARNLPYSQIGTLNGNPRGTLSDLPNAIDITVNGIDYKIYYVVSFVDDPADGTILAGSDLAPNDYKQIKLYIKNTLTEKTSSFFTTMAPKGLESLNGGGALAIEVFDAVGQPVPNASITITNTALNPPINLSRTTNTAGNWVEVGLPESSNSYHITATKSGYSSDQTYPISVGNPDPTKPDATILDSEVTQVSFSIDRKSDLVFNTLNQTCGAISGVGVQVQGEKLIGTPNVLKFDNNYTSNYEGKINLSNIEWDNYAPGLTGGSLMIYGSSPIQQINLLPDTSQQFTLVLGPETQHALLVIVKDEATGNAIEGVNVNVTNEDLEVNLNKITDGSIWSSTDWSGGPTQVNFADPTKYFDDSGTVDTTTIPTGVRLANFSGPYASSGYLTSSTFDTGTDETAYTTLEWQPQSQDPATEVKFQIATNNDNETWDYVGPDGTASTYFTVPGTTVNTLHNGNRYIRYRMYLSTSDDTKTPVITSVNLNYVAGCKTPGQAMFSGLQSHSNYIITASMTGYQTKITEPIILSGYNVYQLFLSI